MTRRGGKRGFGLVISPYERYVGSEDFVTAYAPTAPRTSGQEGVRCVIMRGGTSKGLYFHEADLPGPGPLRDRLLLRLMGPPDILQIDGLGGSRPITSKVAIIAPSQRDDADVDYTFVQVGIDSPVVGYGGNCGNISSGVGPFAIEEGLVAMIEPVTQVHIYNTNTGALLTAEVPVRDGRVQVEGHLAVPGVPGTGAEIVMNWAATVGAKTGRLLPTGQATEEIALETGLVVHATLCDAGNPCVWVPVPELGRTAGETPEQINDDLELLATVREIRGKAAVRMGLATDWARENAMPNTDPKIPSRPATAGVSVVGPDGGESIQLGPTRMRILEDGSTTGHRLGVGEITLAPHTDGPPQHRHARHDEGFYVVSGTARFTVGETSYDAPAGTLVMIPPGAPHTFANPTDETTVILNTFTPDLYVNYFRDLRDMIASGGALTPETTIQAMSRYATEPATDFA
jgi:2-methylaconitate cis-trans-isomerase PrpF/quercetin dioxygenase-like cupin family protein